MNKLMDIAIYIVLKAQAQGKDPVELASIVARKLRFHSIDTETLLTAVYIAKYFRTDALCEKDEIERTVSQTPEYKKIQELIAASPESR